MLYTNGLIPLDVVSVVLKSGYDSQGRLWEHRCTPASAARWAYAVSYAQKKWGRVPKVKDGANFYRNRAWQYIARQDACAAGNCNGASVVGWSSHGGNWGGRDCLAVDVNPNGLTWAQVWEAMTAAGFACGLITEKISGIPGGEPWHCIDFAAFGPMPAFETSTPFPVGGFLMALTDQQQSELYAWVADIQKRVRGDNPAVDILQEIRSAAEETHARVRGPKPDVDMLQDILGRVGGTVEVDVAAIVEGIVKAGLARVIADELSRRLAS